MYIQKNLAFLRPGPGNRYAGVSVDPGFGYENVLPQPIDLLETDQDYVFPVLVACGLLLGGNTS